VGFGEKLQREREMRGITLDEIAKATKIGTRSLRALEQEDFNKLPGGIFNKGFVRAYARYLGIDEEQAVADYLTAIDEPESPDTEGEQLKQIEANWKPSPGTVETEATASASHRSWWGVLVVLLVFGVLIVLAWRFGPQAIERLKARRQSHNQQIERAQQTTAAAYQSDTASADSFTQPQLPATVTPAADPANSAASAAGDVATGNTGSTQQEFVVNVRASADSWVSIKADGKTVLHGMLKASREQAIRAQGVVVLTAGNAGGVEVSFNGIPQPSLGPANKVRTVTFTPQGMQSPAAH
jgi:cytoskeleton protein RodZ